MMMSHVDLRTTAFDTWIWIFPVESRLEIGCLNGQKSWLMYQPETIHKNQSCGLRNHN